MGYQTSAILAALSYGVADFVGGFTSKRTPVLVIALGMNLFAGILFTGLAFFDSGPMVSGQTVYVALIGGVAYAIAILSLYRSLALGPMMIAAPISGLIAIFLPTAAGYLIGEEVSALGYAGIATGCLAVLLVSQGVDASSSGGTHPIRQTVLLSLCAGAGFGVFFIAIDHSAGSEGIWNIVVARYGAIGALLLALGWSLSQETLTVSGSAVRSGLPFILMAGVSDALANLFYQWAVSTGPIALVTTLTSLFPAATVALSLVILKERPRPIQWAGGVLALAAIAMIVNS